MNELTSVVMRYESATGKLAWDGREYSHDFVNAVCKKLRKLEEVIVAINIDKVDISSRLGELKLILSEDEEVEVEL